MVMSKSSAGKLGAVKMKETVQLRMQARINEYNKNPLVCPGCNNSIAYEKRHNKFCSHSCATSFNNKSTGHIVVYCPNCNKEMDCVKHRLKKFCSQKCKHEFVYKERIQEWQNTGVNPGKENIKKYLKQTCGDKCSECSITVWNNKPIVLELEHKDGNADNDKVDNLCLLCPNCHSQTDTYKSKNKGNGRHYRRLRYAEGKSY